MTTNIVNIVGNNFGGRRPMLPPDADLGPIGPRRPHGPECCHHHDKSFGDTKMGSKLGDAAILNSIFGGVANILTGGLAGALGGGLFGGGNQQQGLPLQLATGGLCYFG